MHARLKDDQVEQIKLKRTESIATRASACSDDRALRYAFGAYGFNFSIVLMGDVCVLMAICCCVVVFHEIGKTFDLYTATCPYTQQFFASFEPWMISRLSELATAYQTMSDDNVALLLQQQTEEQTIGFIRREQSLAMLVGRSGTAPATHVEARQRQQQIV
ncbi:hypothetical protein PINS_up022662 [Pythium insidiosum]|nr:hypothetical protein PINS_up022662 [Pythium insidiosum]